MNEVPFSVSAPTDRPDFDVEGGIARRPDTGDGLGLDLLEPEKPVREEAPKEEPAKPNAGRVEGTHGNPAADFDPDAQDKAVQLGLITPAEAQMAKEVAALSTATWGAEARRIDAEFLADMAKPEFAADPDLLMSRCDEYVTKRVSDVHNHGNILNHDMQPFTDARSYADTLIAYVRGGWDEIATDEFRAVKAAVQGRDRDALIRMAGIETMKDEEIPGTATVGMAPGSVVPQNQHRTVAKTDDELNAEVGEYVNGVMARNFVFLYNAMKPELSDRGAAMVDKVIETGSFDPADIPEFRRIYAENREEADRIWFLAQSARPTAPALGTDTWYETAKMMRDVGTKASYAMEGLWGKVVSAYEDMRLSMRERERMDRLVAEGVPVKEAEAIVGRDAANRRATELAGEKDRLEMRRAELELDELSSHKSWEGYGWWERSLKGMAVTLPYMGLNALPFGVGFVLNSFYHMQDIEDQINLDGGDPEAGRFVRSVGAVAWAGIEKLEFAGLFGRTLTRMEKRALWLGMMNGGMRKVVPNAWEIGKAFGKEISAKAAYETFQEGAQGAVEAIEYDMGFLNHLDPKKRKAAGDMVVDAVGRFFGDMKESFGTMAGLALGGTGTGMARNLSRQYRNALDGESLSDFLNRKNGIDAMIDGTWVEGKGSKEQHQREAWDKLVAAWTESGTREEALSRIEAEFNFSESDANRVADFLDLRAAAMDMITKEAGDATQAELMATLAGVNHRFRIGNDTVFDVVDFYRLLNPDIRVEDVEVEDEGAEPVEAPDSDRLAALREEKAALVQEVLNAKVGSDRRGAQRKLRRVSKKIRAEEGRKPEPKKPTKTLRRVTVPVTGADGIAQERHIVVREDSAEPDITTEGFSVSVAEALMGTGVPMGGEAVNDAESAKRGAKWFRELAREKPEEARLFLTTHDLKHTGSFEVTDEDSGRRLADADGIISIARAVSPIVERGGNLSLAHEHVHAIVGFAKRIGVFGDTEAEGYDPAKNETVVALRKLFGEPTHKDELFDEESFANGLGAYLRDEYDFARHGSSDNRELVERIFDGIADIGKGIVKRFFGKDVVTTREANLRRQGQVAAFEAIRNGDFRGLGKYAGIRFTEEKEAAPEGEAAPAEKPVEEPKREPWRRRKRPEAAPQAPSADPSEVADLRAANEELMRQLAEARRNPNPVRATNAPHIVKSPSSPLSVKAVWEWIPRSQIVAAKAGAANQQRDRENNDESFELCYKRTRKGHFDPLYLTANYTGDSGAAILGGGNECISGNGRQIMLSILSREGRYAEYLDPVREWCRANGVADCPEGLLGQEPELVQRVVEAPSKEVLDQFARECNENNKQELNDIEKAKGDAEKITPKLMRLYDVPADGNFLAKSNHPFILAFLDALHASGAKFNDGTPTPAAADRVKNAFLGLLLGVSDSADAAAHREVFMMLQTLMQNSDGLAVGELRNALLRNGAELYAMLGSRGSYNIIPELRAGVKEYIGWRSAQKNSPNLSFADYLGTMDFFKAAVTPLQEAVARLLDTAYFNKVLRRYNELVSKEAVDAQASLGIEGAERHTAAQLLAMAERDVVPIGEDGQPETPYVTREPSYPGYALQEQTPPAVSAPVQEDEDPPKDELEAAERVLAPEPEKDVPFVPVPASRGTAEIPAKGAKFTVTYRDDEGRPQKNEDGSLRQKTMSGGAWNYLRNHYNVKSLPPESEQDRKGRGLWRGRSRWGGEDHARMLSLLDRYQGRCPHYMGNKNAMTERTVKTLYEAMSPSERAHYTTVVDCFGGGGCWGLTLAMTSFPNARRLIVNEFDQGRIDKIRLLQTHGAKLGDEVLDLLRRSGVREASYRALVASKGRISSVPHDLRREAIRALRSTPGAFSTDEMGMFQAYFDVLQSMGQFGKQDETGDYSADATVEYACRVIGEDAELATSMAEDFKGRGGSITYVGGDAKNQDTFGAKVGADGIARWTNPEGEDFSVPHGDDVMKVTDVPYYRTTGYDDDGKSVTVGFERNPRGWGYRDTEDLLINLVAKGDGIIYTDEAWWISEKYAEDHSGEGQGDLFGGGFSKSLFTQENEVLLNLINNLDHFDVAGRIGTTDRTEVLGVHHGHDNGKLAEGTGGAAGGESADRGSAGRTAQSPAESGDAGSLGDPVGAGAEGGARAPGVGVESDAQGEARGVHGLGDGGGRAGVADRIVAVETCVQHIEKAIEEAGAKVTPEVDGIVRHSVRQVREDRIAAYARLVSKNAKDWLKGRTAELDRQMRRHGYTEKVWHGTGAGEFNVFRLAKRAEGRNSSSGGSDDNIRMAFFSYYEDTASNYAALSAFDIDEDYEQLRPGGKPDIRQYYVNPGKCLVIDEGKTPLLYDEWTKLLHKAWKDGYDSIKCINSLDDAGARVREDAEGEYFEWSDPRTYKGPKGTGWDEDECNYRTDILVVFDHGRKNPGANRIKAADPVTFLDDGMPIPLSMRSDRSKADLRYSVRQVPRLAPNGKPSNLDERQWHQVRTPEFKAWFGDWEKDPANASKVLDENGEPLVVWHGGEIGIHGDEWSFKPYENTHFGTKRAAALRPFWRMGDGFAVPLYKAVRDGDGKWRVVPNEKASGKYAKPDLVGGRFDTEAEAMIAQIRHEYRREDGTSGVDVQPYFLNIRNPYAGTDDVDQEITPGGYDGIRYVNKHEDEGSVSWVAAEPNSVKSAEYNDGGFSAADSDIRHAIRIGKKAMAEARRLIAKHRPGIHGFTTNVNGTLKPLDTAALDSLSEDFDTTKEWKIALHWFCRGTVRLPEDAPKIQQAVRTAENAKVDPFGFKRPGDILEKYAEFTPREPAVDPDTVPELSDRKELGHGVVTYLVQDDKAGQAAMRRVINTHFGEDASPWCLLQGDNKGGLSDSAWGYWQNYSALPKRVAFKDGKLAAFMATDEGYDRALEDDELYTELDERFGDEYATQGREDEMLIDFVKRTHPEVFKPLIREQWWDRNDEPHEGIPFTETEGDRTVSRELMRDGKVITIRATKGDPKVKDGVYEEWDYRRSAIDVVAHVVLERRDGMDASKTCYNQSGGTVSRMEWDRGAETHVLSHVYEPDGRLYCVRSESTRGGDFDALWFRDDGTQRLISQRYDKSYDTVVIDPGDGAARPETVSFNHSYYNAEGRQAVLDYLFTDGVLTQLKFGYSQESLREVMVDDFNRLYIPRIDGKEIAELIEAGWKEGQLAPFTSLMGRTNPRVPAVTAPSDERTLSPENEAVRHSIIAGARGSTRGNVANDRLAKAWEMLYGADYVRKHLGDILVGDTRRPTEKEREDIYRETGWWVGADGLWRFEIADMKPKPVELREGVFNKPGLSRTAYGPAYAVDLGEVVTNTRLWKLYPRLKEQTVFFLDPNHETLKGVSALWDGITIVMSKDALDGRPEDGAPVLLNERGLADLTHEVQHIVQDYEGFAPGGTVSAYGRRNYTRLAGEVEARNAEQRRAVHNPFYGEIISPRADADVRGRALEDWFAPWQSQDVPEDRVLIADGFGKMKDVRGNPVTRRESAVASPDERTLSPENEAIRHSIMMGFVGTTNSGIGTARLLQAWNTLYGEKWVEQHFDQLIHGRAPRPTDTQRNEVYVKTGWWMGADGKWRIEIPNVKPKAKVGATSGMAVNGLLPMMFKDGSDVRYCELKDIATATALFRSYPQMKSIDVVVRDPDADDMEGVNGYYDGERIVISWDLVKWIGEEPSNVLTDEGVRTLTHEIQHVVQHYEGFAYGGSTKGYGSRNYTRLAGEVEARNAEKRNTNFKVYGGYRLLASGKSSPDLRKWAVDGDGAPWQTEDVPLFRQLITYGDGKMKDVWGNSVTRRESVVIRDRKLAEMLYDRPITKAEIARAVKMFGTTDRPEDAGYILPDGRYLDYRKLGDHHEIVEALGPNHYRGLEDVYEREMDVGGDDAQYGDPNAAVAVAGGLVRLVGGLLDQKTHKLVSATLEVGKEPTAKQFEAIRRYVDRLVETDGIREVDIGVDAGNDAKRQYYKEYPVRQLDRALEELKRFFATGELPKGRMDDDETDVLSFHGDDWDDPVRESVISAGRYRGRMMWIARGVKAGDPEAIGKAAELLSAYVPRRAVLVPMPSHTGRATTMLSLAEAISDLTGAKVVDALRSNRHESNWAQKRRGVRPAAIRMRRTEADVPRNRHIIIVDNVVDSGVTSDAALRVFPDADVLALSQTRITRERANAAGALAAMTGDRRELVRRGKRTAMSPLDMVTGFAAAQILGGRKLEEKDIDAVLRNLGIAGVNAPEALSSAKYLAKRKRERAVDRVIAADPNLFVDLANENLRLRVGSQLDQAIHSGAWAADPEIGMKVQKAAQAHARRALDAAKGFSAREMQAELPISLSDAVLSEAEYEKSPEVKARLEAERKKREEERERQYEEDRKAAEAAGMTVAEWREAQAAKADEDTAYVEPDPEQKAYFDELWDRAKLGKEAADRKKAKDAAKRARNRALNEATDGGSGGAGGNDGEKGGDVEGELPLETVKRIAPVFESADMFAHFLAEWCADNVVKRHPEIPNTAQMWRNPVAVRELVRTAQNVLTDLASDVLGTPSVNAERNWADRAILKIEERKSFRGVVDSIAFAYDLIHNDALKMSRRKLVDGLIAQIEKLAAVKGRFSAVREADARKADARTELWARHLLPYLKMGEDSLNAEIEHLKGIVEGYNRESAAEGYNAENFTEYRDACDRLALAMKYGGMIRWMPARIKEASKEIVALLSGRRAEFERMREEHERADYEVRTALIDAIEAGALPEGKFADRPGWLARYADSVIGSLELRLRDLVSRCTDETKFKAALDAVQEVMFMIGRGAERHRILTAQGNAEVNEGLKSAYGSAEAGIRHLNDEIPDEIAAEVFNQRTHGRPTYGQLLQLYASCLQRDYRDNVMRHGRGGQIELMKSALSDGDLAFHAWAVDWYIHNRQELSDAVEEITGLPVTSPDTFYCPVRVLNEQGGFDPKVVAWSPVPAALNRRVRHQLDFDENVTFLACLQEQIANRAQIIAYGMAGIRLRNIVAHHEVQAAARKHTPSGTVGRINAQVRDVLVSGVERKDHAAFLDALNVSRAWLARFYLSGNIVSAATQIASVPVWANVIGFRNTVKYMATAFTPSGWAAIRELMEADGYKARYVCGWSEETQNVLRHPGKGVIGRGIDWAYRKGMSPISFVDKVASLWVGQGLYRSLKAEFADRGYSPEEAKARAATLVYNAIETTQQSGRVENLNQFQREHGAIAGAIFQFMTSPLIQLNFEIEAFREAVRGTPEGKRRLARALIINHVLVPAAIQAIRMGAEMLMGAPPDDDPNKMPDWVKQLAVAMVMGQTAPLYLIYAVGENVAQKIVGYKPPYHSGSSIPAEGIIRVADNVGRLAVSLGKATVNLVGADLEVTGEEIAQDFDRVLKSMVAPYRLVRKAQKYHE